MRSSTRLHARQGFTLIELLVVISIIAILAGMLIPAIGMIQNNAKRQKSGKNMSGIVAALIQYQSDEGSWPEASNDAQYLMDGTITGAEQLNLVTVGSFYVLTSAFPSDISKKLFTLPGEKKAPEGKPKKDYAADDPKSWGWVGNTPKDYRMPYAFDWSTSTSPGSNRVLVGDREPSAIDLKKAVVVCGDGRTLTLDVENGSPTGTVTIDVKKAAPIGGKVVYYKEAGDDDDNVWDDNLDDEDGTYSPFTSGYGNPTRAFLK